MVKLYKKNGEGGIELRKNEYEWVKQNRKELLKFCGEINKDDFTREFEIGWSSIRNTLIHIADCYNAWLGSFVLLKTKTPLTPKADIQHMNLEQIVQRYEQVDQYVNDVFNELGEQLDQPIERKIPWRSENEIILLTPAKLLMHTITHEYHHKGQIMAMARQLGYKPPNTDILGTDD